MLSRASPEDTDSRYCIRYALLARTYDVIVAPRARRERERGGHCVRTRESCLNSRVSRTTRDAVYAKTNLNEADAVAANQEYIAPVEYRGVVQEQPSLRTL